MGRVLRFLKWATHSGRRNGKLRPHGLGVSPYHRRLVCEPLELRTLLSVSLHHPAGSPLASFVPKGNSAVSGPAYFAGTSTPYGSATPAGLSPNQIRGAYGLGGYTSGVLSNGISFAGIQGDGRGQTIAVVDAYDYPTALSDLNAFSTYYGLPTFNGSGGPTFEKLDQTGGTSLPGTDPAGPSNSDWEGEEALDIEWAHAIAPMANIMLFEATDDTNNGSNLFLAAQAAANTPGVVAVSMSWTFNESSFTAKQVSAYDSMIFTTPSGHIGGAATLGGAGLPGSVTFLCAAGDNGPYPGDGTTTIAPQYPATSPNVIAVGGTTLTVNGINPHFTYGGEAAWGDGINSSTDGGSGGGISADERQPAYQSGVVSAFSSTKRTYPDVSANADPNSGVAVYDAYDDGTSTPWADYVGGTSLSCPMWAGIIAIADEGRALAGQGSLNGRSQTLPELYKLPAADFHDITSGTTGPAPTYAAGTGYDLTTGLGSPVANLLIPGLVAYQPTVTGIGPVAGSTLGGTSVTITGTDLSGGTLVDFGTTPAASVTVVSATTITAISPAGSGMVHVTVTGPGGTSTTSSADEFTFTNLAPTVTGISPSSGPALVGVSVTITGTSFSAVTAVDFGPTAATSFVVNSATQITATSPAGSLGPADVTVTTASGTSSISSADSFTYMPPTVAQVSSTQATGTYVAGTAIPITVTFSEPVTVTGTPQLALNSGNGAVANYSSGSGTATLTFTYTVAAGQITADLDYASTAALGLAGGSIQDAAGNTALLTLPATQSDGLAARDIALALWDGFESGDFSALPWQLSSAGTAPANWTVQSGVAHAGSYAAQAGAVGASSSSTLNVSLTESAGEFSFWRKLSSASGNDNLVFAIDGVPQLQWSGTTPWQQSFYWVSAGQHTFSWIYSEAAGTPAAGDAAWLDDVQFTSGTTLTVSGAAPSDQFSFNASGASVVVTLNGESHSFPAGEFSNYVFHGDGGTAFLTGGTGGNAALFYANGSGQLDNSTAGYAVAVDGMAAIDAFGHAGDTAQFFDSAGHATYFAYGNYNNSGQPLAGMVGSGYSDLAGGFGTNIAYSTNGGSDTAVFFDSQGNATFYAYADYNNSGQPLAGMAGAGYSNLASGFAANAAYSTSGASDSAMFFDSPGNDTFYSYGNYNKSGRPLAGMYGSGYFNAANGFGSNAGYSINGGNDTAVFFDAPGNNTFYAYADYDNSAEPFAGMVGSGYSNLAAGFATNVGYSINGGNDTAEFFDSPGLATFFAYADYNNSGQPLAGMYGTGYTNLASGFGTNVGSATGGSATADLYGPSGNDTLYASQSNALLYGSNYAEEASGFQIVNATGGSGVNSKGHGTVNYQLNYFGTWIYGG